MWSCRLRPVDIEFMKALQDKVNVVPLIAKADCLTPSEIKKLKERVRPQKKCSDIHVDYINNPQTPDWSTLPVVWDIISVVTALYMYTVKAEFMY